MMKSLFFLLILVFGIRAQSEKWYFAWRDQTPIAFTASGETRVLGEFDAEYARGFRLSDASALVGLYTGYDIHALAYLTPDGFTLLRGAVDLELLGSQDFEMLAYEHPYVVIMPNDCHFQWCQYSRPLWVANVNAGTVEMIALHVYGYTRQSLGLSGHLLRYARRKQATDTHWTVWERDLETGEERAFYDFISPMGREFPWPIALNADSSGEFWLHQEPAAFSGGEEFWRRLIRSDGSIEILDHIPAGEIPQYTWTLADDWLLRQRIECTRACQLEARPVSGGEWQSFSISDNGYFEFIQPLGEGRALALQVNAITWILRASGPPLPLGRAHEISPDFKWLLTVHDPSDLPSTYRVWDVQNERVALEGVVKEGIRAAYYDGGFLIEQFSLGMGQTILTAARQEDPLPILLYRYLDGKTFGLQYSNYFDVLPDGSLLESRYEDGIYRLDLEGGAETLLVPEAQVVNLR
jgi:hypothetical protein